VQLLATNAQQKRRGDLPTNVLPNETVLAYFPCIGRIIEASWCAELGNALAFRFLYAESRYSTCKVTHKTGSRDNLPVVKEIRNRIYRNFCIGF